MITKFINILINFIYPNKCVFCEEAMPIDEKDGICKHCYMKLNFITDVKEPNLFLFSYDEVTRHAILRLKYYNRREYSKIFAKMMYNKLSKINIKNYDYIMYVPMHIKKKKKRGYDQAQLLANELSKLSNIPIDCNNLIRTKNTVAQSKVSYEERALNVKNVFTVLNPEKIKDKNILLIDDIYTTGNTINNCIKALKIAGANNICYFTLAKVVHKKYIDIEEDI